MLKKILIQCVLILSSQSFSQNLKNITSESTDTIPYCNQTIDTTSVALAGTAFTGHMLFHIVIPGQWNLPLIGQRTNLKSHISTFLMIAIQSLILKANYPSKTFDVLGSFTLPIIVFGGALNINRMLGRTIEQNTIVKGGRIFLGLTSTVLAPLYWWNHDSNCAEANASEEVLAELPSIDDNL